MSAVQCVLFVLVLVDKHSVTYRKLLYYVYFTLSIAFAVLFAAAIIVLAVSDLANPQFETACRDNPDLYPGKYTVLSDCIGFINKMAITFMSIMFLIFVPIRFAMCRVLKHGY